jgi:hypothetical protein
MKSKSVRNDRPVGTVKSGGDSHDEGREVFQADADTERGAAEQRVRKSESTVTLGHHVQHGDDPNGKNRRSYVEAERRRKDDKTASPSGRKPLSEMLKK